MLYDCKRIPNRIHRRLNGLAEPDYDATLSFGLPFEPEDSQYGKSRLSVARHFKDFRLLVLSQLEYDEQADADLSPLPSWERARVRVRVL